MYMCMGVVHVFKVSCNGSCLYHTPQGHNSCHYMLGAECGASPSQESVGDASHACTCIQPYVLSMCLVVLHACALLTLLIGSAVAFRYGMLRETG